MNPYTVLGLKRGATEKEITKAYRNMALLHHPDKRSTSTGSDQIFHECKEAYQLLIDPKSRAELDLKLIGEEERKRRVAGMDEARKQMRKDLLERERAASNGKSNSVTTTASTTATASTPKFRTPIKPEFALLLKVKAGGPLPVTVETLSATLNLPANAVQLDALHGQAVAEFDDAHVAASALDRLPVDQIVRGDWWSGVAPAELFEGLRVSSKSNSEVKPEEQLKFSKDLESSVLAKLRKAAAAKKQMPN